MMLEQLFFKSEAAAVLSAQGANACVASYKGDVTQYNWDLLPQQLKDAELDAGTKLILSTGSNEAKKFEDVEMRPTLLKIMQMSRRDAGLSTEEMANALGSKLSSEKNCRGTIAFIKSALVLQGKERGMMLDYMAESQ